MGVILSAPLLTPTCKPQPSPKSIPNPVTSPSAHHASWPSAAASLPQLLTSALVPTESSHSPDRKGPADPGSGLLQPCRGLSHPSRQLCTLRVSPVSAHALAYLHPWMSGLPAEANPSTQTLPRWVQAALLNLPASLNKQGLLSDTP